MLSKLGLDTFFRTGLLLVCCAILVFILTRCVTVNKAANRHRGDLLKEMSKIGDRFHLNTTNQKIRLHFAKILFESGDFLQSEEILQPLLNTAHPPIEALWLMAHLKYLVGKYDHAEEVLHHMIERAHENIQVKIKAEVGLVFVYYQTRQYAKSLALFKGMEEKIQLPIWDLMKSFNQERPYQIEWNGKTKTEVPFLITDPLPIIAVEIQGKPIYAIIDTGAETLYLDTEIANSLGITPIVQHVEYFAGGKQTEVGYARADSLKIGDVTLTSIPIKLGSINRFSEIISNEKYPISVVLGTGELRQFLPTIDYVNGRSTLRPKTEEGKRALQEEMKGKTVTEVPFVLALTHVMIAKGTLNDKENLAFFVDSGLAHSEAAMLAPKQTLNYAGIPIPETEKVPEPHGGLAGGGFSVGCFPVENLGLGTLRQRNLKGLYGVFPSELYWDCEFIVDGIISHQFLRNYAWTIDFSDMNMIFVQ